MTTDIDKALAFTPPPLKKLNKTTALFDRYFAPECIGLENIDRSAPTLFVGNHTRFGMLDTGLIPRAIYQETGKLPRGLADRRHFMVPYWRDFLLKNGAVLGSREICSALMKAGESLMVFPGGAREVMRPRGTNYKLLWKNRMGFARMAIAHGYSITPFCSVGPDEAFDAIIDGEDIMNSVIGKLIRKLGGDPSETLQEQLPPLPRGIGLSAIPRPEKFYFAFGKPIQTKSHGGKADDVDRQTRVRNRTAKAIEKLLADTIAYRDEHRSKQSVWRKILQGT